MESHIILVNPYYYISIIIINDIYAYVHLPFTVNIPELLSVPKIFSASQVYVPTSDDSAFIILRVHSIMDSFRYTDELLYLELSDKFTRTPLKYHLIFGAGTPMA